MYKRQDVDRDDRIEVGDRGEERDGFGRRRPHGSAASLIAEVGRPPPPLLHRLSEYGEVQRGVAGVRCADVAKAGVGDQVLSGVVETRPNDLEPGARSSRATNPGSST